MIKKVLWSWIRGIVVHLLTLSIRFFTFFMVGRPFDGLFTHKRHVFTRNLAASSDLWPPVPFWIWKKTRNFLCLRLAKRGDCSGKVCLVDDSTEYKKDEISEFVLWRKLFHFSFRSSMHNSLTLWPLLSLITNIQVTENRKYSSAQT